MITKLTTRSKLEPKDIMFPRQIAIEAILEKITNEELLYYDPNSLSKFTMSYFKIGVVSSPRDRLNSLIDFVYTQDIKAFYFDLKYQTYIVEFE
jgi:hypothetical protein